MKLLDRFKNKRREKNNNIYDELGIIKPFTILVDNQFNLFISKLIDNKYGLLKESINFTNALWGCFASFRVEIISSIIIMTYIAINNSLITFVATAVEAPLAS